jgi:hypothetical protein
MPEPHPPIGGSLLEHPDLSKIPNNIITREWMWLTNRRVAEREGTCMTALTNEVLSARVMELAKPAAEFTPTAYHDPDGDCIEFLARPDNFHAERVDDLLTVYHSEETGEIIGALFDGISRFRDGARRADKGRRIISGE